MKKTTKYIPYLSGGILLSAFAAPVVGQSANTPNVIYFLCDDLGFSDIEAYGNQHISTPNLSKLAANGMSFTQHYSGSTVSAPSRATLMTGQHTGHTHVRGHIEYATGQLPLDPNVKILPQMFKSVGYSTGIFGKWGLGYEGSITEPNDVGFDTFYGYNNQVHAHNYYPTYLWNNATKESLDGKTYAQDLIHQQALKFIRDNKDKPFFGYFSYVLPHASLEQPNDSIYQRYVDKYPETTWGSPTSHYTMAEKPRAQLAGMITRIDTYVGQIMAELEAQGILDNTIFIFTSDNGPHTEGGADPNFFNTEKRLKGTKRSLYEGGVRVPFIVQWKGKVPANTTSHHISAFWDMMPTFTEILGIQSSWTQETDGISILPTLTNSGTQATHEYMYWEFKEANLIALRQGPWKLIKFSASSANPVYELYNLDEDLGETNNLAAKNPTKLEELKQIMSSARTVSPLSQFNF